MRKRQFKKERKVEGRRKEGEEASQFREQWGSKRERVKSQGIHLFNRTKIAMFTGGKSWSLLSNSKHTFIPCSVLFGSVLVALPEFFSVQTKIPTAF